MSTKYGNAQVNVKTKMSVNELYDSNMATKQEIISLISECCGISNNEINESSQLLKDLHIWGDDALDLINRFSTEYGVDMLGFEFSKYFPSEGSFIFSIPFLFKVETKYVRLTVTDLVEIANRRKWNTNETGSE